MALLSAVDAVFALLGAFFPMSSLFLMVVVPLTSAIAAFLLPLRYLPLFVLIAFSVCLGSSFWDFQNTIFYIFPSLVIGALFGFFTVKRVPEDCGLFLLSLCECLLFGIALLLIYAIYGISMEEVLLALFHLTKNEYLSHVFPLFCLVYSYAQMAVTYLFMRLFLERLGFEKQPLETPRWVGFAFGGTFLLLGLLTFVYPLVGYFFLGATSYWIVETSIRSLPYARKGIYVLLGLGLFGGLLLFALLFSSCPGDTGLGLIVLPMAVILLCNSLSRPLLEKKSDNKMKS